MGTKLYVGNLNYNTTEQSLREAFGADGREVASVSIIMDRETGRSRGFAFVEMATAKVAAAGAAGARRSRSRRPPCCESTRRASVTRVVPVVRARSVRDRVVLVAATVAVAATGRWRCRRRRLRRWSRWRRASSSGCGWLRRSAVVVASAGPPVDRRLWSSARARWWLRRGPAETAGASATRKRKRKSAAASTIARRAVASATSATTATIGSRRRDPAALDRRHSFRRGTAARDDPGRAASTCTSSSGDRATEMPRDRARPRQPDVGLSVAQGRRGDPRAPRSVTSCGCRPRSDRARAVDASPRLSAHTLAHHGAWLGEVIDQIVPGPLVLVAQDWGGPIGLRAMVDRVAAAARARARQHRRRPAGERTSSRRCSTGSSQLPIVSDVLFRGLGFPLGVLHLSQGDRSIIRGDVARAYRWPLRTAPDRVPRRSRSRAWCRTRTRTRRARRSRSTRGRCSRPRRCRSRSCGARSDPILGRVISHLARLRPDATVTRTQARALPAGRSARALADGDPRGRRSRRIAVKEKFEVAADDAGLRLDQVVPEARRRPVAAQGARGDRSRRRVRRSHARQGRGPAGARGQMIEVNVGGALERTRAAARAAIVFTRRPRDRRRQARGPGHRADARERSRRSARSARARSSARSTSSTASTCRPAACSCSRAPATRTSGSATRSRLHDVEREYRAVAVGDVAAQTIDRPIDGSRAVTHVAVVEALAGATLVSRAARDRPHPPDPHPPRRARPPGRRRHAARRRDRAGRSSRGPPRLALHAAVLGFTHPATGERVRFESPWPTISRRGSRACVASRRPRTSRP